MYFINLTYHVYLPLCCSSVIKINPPENDTFFDVVAIVDPLTRAAQQMAQLLAVR